ncbi:MAG: response regulator [Chitinophagaceae bacterium]|nr:response regulator [Chitinophagaceae bacterium]
MKLQTSKKTFIVDDDPFWTAILSEILTDMGYSDIVTFTNGTDCINNLHLNPVLVFLDYQMEDLDGLAVLKAIKEYFPRIGVVFCTAHEDLSVAVDAIKHGSFDYLLKSNANKKEVASILAQMKNEQVFANKVY